MQTRKKVSAGNGVRHVASTRCRPSRKLSEQPHVRESKVTDLITSSGRKQRLANGIDPIKDAEAAIKVSKECASEGNEYNETHLSHVEDGRISNTHQGYEERNPHCMPKTIFSPTFHIFKDGVSGVSGSGDAEVIRSKDQVPHPLNSVEDDYHNDLSSEVSAVYLAMQQSKLECIEESSDNSMSIEVCVETDEDEEIDDFDPYFFIKKLPDLSSVVPAFRPMLLPKQTRSCPPTTLVLDLDETLVHSSLVYCKDADFTFTVNFNLEDHTVYVRCRPYLKDFMERVAGLFEIIVFTASQRIYAEKLLNVLDPRRKLFRHRVFRDSCVYLEGNYLKDLSVLGRDLARVIIVDNSPQAFGFQVNNGIPIISWYSDRSDCALLDLLPFLESLVGVEDVRPVIAKKFNLQEKVASAVDLYSNIE